MFKRKRKQKLNTLRFQKPANKDGGWRGYQNNIKIHDERRQSLRRIPKYLAALFALVLLIHGGFAFLEHRMLSTQAKTTSLYPPGVVPLDRDGLRQLLSYRDFHNPDNKEIEISSNNSTYRIYTSLDMDLQNAIVNLLDTRYANRIGIVAIEPDTGRVLAMASHDREDPGKNACLAVDLPAASIFKIVTASAALEAGELDYLSKMFFNGGKYTLYRNQLTDQKHQFTTYTTLKNAFAESINPVFGKLGKRTLGKNLLQDYGHAYYFNRCIDFDLATENSVLEISDTPYNWAEIASGFNRQTTISPLHAAIIAASVINGGKMMTPSVVDVATRDDKTVYRHRPNIASQAVAPEASVALKELMNATVSLGTAKNQFAGIASDPVLSKLEIGGKTGSINNNIRHIRYDWFAGYAEYPGGPEKIAIAVVVAHEKYIGKRAATYFREAITRYFENRIKQVHDS